ncbi:MAG: NAD-dependent epimerase, partial [Candidatus Puniceispirillaceae bacterium]
MRILVTGVAGFIGMHVAVRLLADGHEVIGIDNLNDYYDVRLKQARLAHIGSPNQFHFEKLDLCDRAGINRLFAERRPEIVINLAAQAGVRYSLENPHSYIESNLVGFTNILEACRHFEVEHLVYASSSSVYGLNEEMPFHEGQNVDHPLALYGATKKANELLAHSYSHLFGLPTTGLRFFTVYGPWGRPDMALFKFTDAILSGRPIDIYNHGQMIRDFTFIDDIVEGVVRLAMKPAERDTIFDAKTPDAGRSAAPWRIFNIGNGLPTPLMDCIAALEKALGKEAKKNFLDMQAGDVVATASDTQRLNDWIGFKP